MLLRIGQDLVYLLKILPGFEYLIVLVLLLLFVKTVLLAMARLANRTSPPTAKKIHIPPSPLPTPTLSRPAPQGKPVIPDHYAA
jgi:hypothetical protein